MRRNGYTFTRENYQYLMNRVDRDGNGMLSKDEFISEKFILPSYGLTQFKNI